MNSFKPLFTSIILLLLTNSCLDGFKTSPEKLSPAKDFQEVNIQDKYIISVPNYMKSTTILNDEASMQYMNALKETYMVVIDEDKAQMIEALKMVDEYKEDQSVLDNYARFQTTSIMEGLNVGSQSEIKSVTVDGKSARVFEADGRLDGVPYDIQYILGFTEGEEDVYMIMTWTLKSRAERYSGTLRQIIKSFKEI
ncbi:hypothetical protein [Spongiivirga citrea]|uniref:Uncharacterized protein n=1 Tax=Spongiivirga citrea TaxID=1481457 RepID=A0A6M0CQN7_9FLAO|nr:hypothetical protein [Spongiivirga citrea]NER16240.1 hypothetical protein [Spongiivirga citrea]